MPGILRSGGPQAFDSIQFHNGLAGGYHFAPGCLHLLIVVEQASSCYWHYGGGARHQLEVGYYDDTEYLVVTHL